MIYCLFPIAYVIFTSYHINREINCLPSFEHFFTTILDIKVSYTFSMIIPFFLVVLLPLLFGLLLIVAYKKHRLNFKRPPSRRYSVLCTMLFYSILIHITADTFFFLEFLTSSKVVYFLFRMGALMSDRSYMMSFVYKSFVLLLLNTLSFIALFFVIETCIAIKSSSITTPFNIFMKKNKVVIASSGIFTAAYALMINFFSHRYHLAVNKESAVHSETLWLGFIGSIMVNTLLMGFYYVLSFDT